MTETSLPWGGSATGDAGPYSNEDWQDLYQMLIGDQNLTDSLRGPLITDYQDSLAASEYGTPNMSVDMAAGAALVDGCLYYSDATENLVIAASDPANPRIDRIVLRLDSSAQTVRLAVKTGTPAGSPSAPALDQTRSPYFEIPLWQVYVGATVTTILDANLTDERCAINVPQRVAIEVTNKSGGTLYPNQVVVWSDSTAQSVTTTTTADDPQVAGVVADIIANNETGRIFTKGCCPVLVDEAVDIGDALVTSTTAKQAGLQGANVFGRALTSTSGAGTTIAAIDAKPVYPDRDFIFQDDNSLGYGIAVTDTWENISATDFSITLTTHGGPVEVWGSITVRQDSGGQYLEHLDFTYDGTRYGAGHSGGTYGICHETTEHADYHDLSFGPVIVNLAPGSHTFRLQWYGHSSTVLYGWGVFGAREIIS